jgi:hypothetical protein
MASAPRKVKPGDPLAIPAATFNTFVDAAWSHAKESQESLRQTDRWLFSLDDVAVHELNHLVAVAQVKVYGRRIVQRRGQMNGDGRQLAGLLFSKTHQHGADANSPLRGAHEKGVDFDSPVGGKWTDQNESGKNIVHVGSPDPGALLQVPAPELPPRFAFVFAPGWRRDWQCELLAMKHEAGTLLCGANNVAGSVPAGNIDREKSVNVSDEQLMDIRWVGNHLERV